MRYLVAVLVAVFAFLGVANAQEQYVREQPYGQVAGDRIVLSNAATNATFNFGFQSERVRICFVSANASDDIVWLRYGHTLVARDDGVATATGDTTGMSVFVTNDTDFQDGVTLTLGPQSNTYTVPPALPLSPIQYMTATSNEGDMTGCQDFPFQTRGLIFHTAAASAAELDVWAYGERPRSQRR